MVGQLSVDANLRKNHTGTLLQTHTSLMVPDSTINTDTEGGILERVSGQHRRNASYEKPPMQSKVQSTASA
jgi:hypothetical protein